ncbi:exopolysaccharide biosynthesis protein [Lactobacillus nasalidis]|uniref:Exopolysaccharide biosynthesis protein n=1 Tax=Lactobacillus nasalidis TaxID=2797258 RepID=A0ABQ3W7Q8_9LACO|nr:sugar transferase [Lactobacillus nasalidis]GHV98486.1 exopolysaccharide biosynthesis protein [Lactobacillus nasalidis]GHV98996.1 exopolysaccharide biosynthesis protein [Lactobacillus nasalidis]GHW00902.1 exopolysaccharide biosynthesis protein [Lactobacillus nasalidis]
MNKEEKSSNYKNNLGAYKYLKRFLDIVGSLLALILFSPVFLILAIIIKSRDGGSAFFAQTRIGQYGKPFKMYKFRSMRMDAEEVLKSDLDLYAKYVANDYKLLAEEDPRITPIGRWMRRTSVDELPQFLNILKGDMSIIGPRPVVEKELEEYGDRVDKFLSVKPGAMGLWQATGRSNIGYPERCDVELEYVDHVSLGYDISIFFKTIVSIFKKEGAY